MNRSISYGIVIGLLLSSGVIGFMPAASAITATGGTITISGTTVIHTFTSSGFFCITAGSGTVDVFVLAGGGGGDAGGGGGGGYRTNSTYPVVVGCYTVTIGAGGAAGSGGGDNAANGGNSIFGNLTSTGGGAGKYALDGAAGGSGGGAGCCITPPHVGGAASPSGQGFKGGNSTGGLGGGGGGGAGATGANTAGATGGNGGAGLSNSYSGTSVCYAGGGGGGGNVAGGTATCGGGNGAKSGGSSAVANRGGGGGGRYTSYPAGNGGSGLVIVRYPIAVPNPVTTLSDTDITTTTVDLAWTAPNMNGGTCQGYRINYTTPWGDPITVILNSTGTCGVTYSVGSLVLNTDYSFRVSAINQAGANINGANILNVTTLAFNQANYTIGSFDFNANNPVLFPIRFERIDNGTSDTRVNVTFANTISLACDLRYTYAMTNHTYHNVSSIPISTTEDEASFHFTNSSNDITTFHCWNENGNETGNYVLTQTDFLLKQQVRDFRNGTYGTSGQLGAFDFITLIVVIIAMIGLNKTNEAVAGFFCIVAISVLAYFEIIQWYIAVISALAVIILLAVSATRKD